MAKALATFAAGCFWGVEAAFRMQKGVVDVTAGYTGGKTTDPTYRSVVGGQTGHVEAVQVSFNPKVISYKQLLNIYWQIHNPTLTNRQGNDTGPEYQAIIFYHDEAQRQAAVASKERLAKSGLYARPIVTQIKAASQFYPAEAEHQCFLEKNPGGYCHIDLKAIR